MKKRTVFQSAILTLAVSFLLTAVLSACGRKNDAATEPVSVSAPVSPAKPGAAAEAGRQDGERYEDTIMLEGMEETVRYEHVRNSTIGIEMDYDYELFERRRESNRECFVSRYDNAEDPQNYLEVTCRAEDADTVAAFLSDVLSYDYDIIREPYMLSRAGSCIRIDASNAKSGLGTPALLQTVTIIPAADGCRVATAHYTLESAEGFGARFRHILNTLAVIDSHAEEMPSITGTWQTASMTYADDGSMYPEYHVQFTGSDIVYGHLRDGAFVFDHTDKIFRLAETDAGGFTVLAVASNGVQYSYQTCAGDPDILEYYETWDKNSFPEMYRGGASLSRLS